MKIVHVVPYMGSGGAEILLGQMALHQKALGHQPAIVTLHPHHYSFENYPDRELLEEQVPIFTTSSRVKFFHLKKMDVLLQEWKNYLDEFKPDVIHSHIYAADLLAHSVVVPRVAYITHIHGPVAQLEPNRSLPRTKEDLHRRVEKQWCHRRYKKCKTHFVAISRDIVNYTKTLIPASLHSRIHLMHNAIEVKNFQFVKRTVSPRIRLVTTGNIMARKNQDFLVHVVDHLQKIGAECDLDVLGFGEQEGTLRQLISRLHLENRIHLRGSVGNVKEYLAAAEIYIHAAQPEPFGIAILEAMATGLPVVCLDGGGNRDFVFNGVNGFLVEEKNAATFAEKILLLKNDTGLYNRLAKEARSTAVQFDIRKYNERMLALYEEVIKSNK